ncbi:MAG: LD-carboxypeptidase [Burkholderiales bacterium]
MSRPVTICIVAPSGALVDETGLAKAKAFFAQRNINVIVPEAVLAKQQRFAGDDDLRLAALHEAARRDDVDIVMAARGGYGLSRLLDRIDYDLLAESKKIFVGHSDFTALLLALYAKRSVVTFAGPNAAYDFDADAPSNYTAENFFRVLQSSQANIAVTAANPYDFTTGGTLWGGNLALVAALVGTPYLPDIANGILFLEDINEHPYRIERMLYQLFHAGILQGQRAILLGDFSGYQLYENDGGYDLLSIVDHFRARLAVPIVTGLPFGHIRHKLTLPIGGRCELTIAAQEFKLTLSSYPVLPNN